tara:strand:+ start:6002 stop:6454 length:453 start_codon:yes stop_codon:yes gene_type:complete
MIFKRTKDIELIKSVVLNNELLSTTKEDSEFSLNVESDCYLACFNKDKIIGVAVFSPESTTTINYHPNLLKECRGKDSLPFTVNALKWLYENASMYKKVNVKFPSIYKHIKVYAEKAGFTFEGTDRQSCKSGDRMMYGITRNEIGELKCQ